MSEHKATVKWARDGADFGYKNYSRGHVWLFKNGIELPALAAPASAAPSLPSHAMRTILQPIRPHVGRPRAANHTAQPPPKRRDFNCPGKARYIDSRAVTAIAAGRNRPHANRTHVVQGHRRSEVA
jgi:hypothetical protein